MRSTPLLILVLSLSLFAPVHSQANEEYEAVEASTVTEPVLTGRSLGSNEASTAEGVSAAVEALDASTPLSLFIGIAGLWFMRRHLSQLAR